MPMERCRVRDRQGRSDTRRIAGGRTARSPCRIAGMRPRRLMHDGPRTTGPSDVSLARMLSPEGWREPGQRPQFEEITVVLRGMLRVEHGGGALGVRAAREWSRAPASGSATARPSLAGRSTWRCAHRRSRRSSQETTCHHGDEARHLPGRVQAETAKSMTVRHPGGSDRRPGDEVRHRGRRSSRGQHRLHAPGRRRACLRGDRLLAGRGLLGARDHDRGRRVGHGLRRSQARRRVLEKARAWRSMPVVCSSGEPSPWRSGGRRSHVRRHRVIA
jgi:hypothetical protein